MSSHLAQYARFARRGGVVRGRARRGGITVGVIMILFVMVASLALAVNWSYLLHLHRHNQRLADQLALGAVAGLLDEGILEDQPATNAQTNQGSSGTDDVMEAEDAVLNSTTGLLTLNNNAASPALRIEANEVTVVPGRIDDASQPAIGANLTHDPTGPLYNTLRVEIRRDPNGVNRVAPLVQGFVRTQAVTIVGGAYATLDGRTVGCRPATNANAPLVPLAVDAAAWSARASGTLDDNGNSRLEIWLELKQSIGDVANAALISLNDMTPLNEATLPGQIANGMSTADGAEFGPAHPSVTYDVDATDFNPSNLSDVQDAFDNLIGTQAAIRIFPLYSAYSSPLSIEGFVGAEVLEVDLTSSRLRVRIEPAFVIHPSSVTQRTIVDAFATSHDVEENLYIHKIRLTR